MSNISDKLIQLSNIKSDIKTAINNKGQSVGDDFSTYANAIDNITTGDGPVYQNPDFYELRTAGGTDYSYLFYYYKMKSLDLSSFDTSNVKKMANMFTYSSLTSLDLSSFDTSNVTTMASMFGSSSSLTSVNLSSFDTSNVTTMTSMFQNCSSLTSLDLSSFDTSNVTSMMYFISGCSKLVSVNGFLDMSSLSDGLYPGSYNAPFNNCTNLETLYLKNIYKNCKITDASKWSINLEKTKLKDECLLYIINELPNLYDKGITNNTKIVFTLPPTNTLTAEQVQPAIDKGWIVANITYEVNE